MCGAYSKATACNSDPLLGPWCCNVNVRVSWERVGLLRYMYNGQLHSWKTNRLH